MHQIECDTRRKLLPIHGLGGSWRSWSTILDALGIDRTVIAIELPGHGATTAGHDSGTVDGLVGSVERYIADNDLVGIDLVGSSIKPPSFRIPAVSLDGSTRAPHPLR